MDQKDDVFDVLAQDLADNPVQEAKNKVFMAESAARRRREVIKREIGGELQYRNGDLSREDLSLALAYKLEQVCASVMNNGSCADLVRRCGEMTDLLVEAVDLYEDAVGRRHDDEFVGVSKDWFKRRIWQHKFSWPAFFSGADKLCTLTGYALLIQAGMRYLIDEPYLGLLVGALVMLGAGFISKGVCHRYRFKVVPPVGQHRVIAEGLIRQAERVRRHL